MRLKTLFAATVLITTAFQTGVALAADAPGAQHVIRAGVILPLSGEAASFGVSVKNGVELALAELSQEQKDSLEISFEDDAFQPARTISAFKRLREFKEIDIVMMAGSQTGKALAPVAEQARVPMLAIASDSDICAQRQYVMNFWVAPREEARLLVQESLRRGYRRIALISSVHDFASTMRNAFVQANAGRIQISLEDEFPGDVRDFRTWIARLRAHKGVDAVFVILMPGSLGVFARQLRQMDIGLPMVGFEFFEDPNEVRISDHALVGQWYINSASPDKDFLARYSQAYPGASYFGAGHGYDFVQLLLKSLQKAGQRDDLNAYFHSLRDFPGVLGTYSATSENVFSLPAAVKIVTSTGFEEISLSAK